MPRDGFTIVHRVVWVSDDDSQGTDWAEAVVVVQAERVELHRRQHLEGEGQVGGVVR